MALGMALQRRERDRRRKEVAYAFGSYRLIPSVGLFRDGETVALPPKESALLELLVRQEGGVVTHRDIERAIWPNQDVSYASIARCVYSLRRTLQADGNPYIVTVTRRGYRLGVPVRHVGTNHSSHIDQLSRSDSSAAVAHYFEGLREGNRMRPDAHLRAISLFEKAHQEDRGYLVPLAAIADSCMSQMIRGYDKPVEANRVAVAACQRALEKDPEIVSALAALGWFRGMVARRYQEGLDLIDASLDLDPDYARAYSYRAWVLRSMGRHSEAVTAARAAVELDPHSMLSLHCLAWTLFLAGGAEEALEIERRARVELSYHDVAHGYVAIFGAFLGKVEEAIDAGREALRVSRNNPGMQLTLAYALAVAGEDGEARLRVQEAAAAGLPRATRSFIAPVYAELGDDAEAITWLEAARAERCPLFPGARFDPRLSRLLSNPEVARLWE